jgi:putative membrane protein
MTLERERRLHRAAIGVYVLKAVRDAALPLLIVVLVSGFGAQGLARAALYGAVGIAIAAVTGWWRWDNTRWWVGTDGIHRKSGLLNTKQTDVPFARIQALDLEQGVVQRWFGVHSVHVQTAGGGAEGEIVLEAISREELDALRALVATPAAEPSPLLPARQLSPAGLLAAALTAGQIGVLLPLLAGGAQLLQNVAGDDAERDAVRLIPHGAGGWLVAAAVLVGAAWLLSVMGAVVAFAGFEVRRDGDRLRIRRGLLERRETTIPVARVRAVVVVEGPLRRPFRLAALRMEVIGHAKEPNAAQALYPLLRRAEVRALLDELLPELADDLDGLAPLPPRALRRYVLPPAVAGLVVGAGLWPLIGFWGLLLVLPLGLWGALGFRAAGWRLAGGHLATRRLGFARTTVLARAADGESHTLAQNILQRRAGLADLSVAFGKRTTARIHHLDAALARDAFAQLTP